MRRKIFLILLFAAITSLPSVAAIYSFRDEKGRLYLTDNPPNDKYKIVVTTKKDRAGPDNPSGFGTTQILTEIAPQKILLPNDETYSTVINEAAQTFDLDPFLIKAVIKVESDFDPRAISSKGAQGLMQLIPTTAKLVGCKNPFDPRDNIFGGAKYLRMILNRFQGNLDFSLAGYNSGPGRVEQYNGVPPIRETRNYVTKVNHYYGIYRAGLPVVKSVKYVARTIPVLPSALSQKLNSAYSIYLENNIEGAIRAYQEILNIYPANAQALYNLACLLDLERRYEEAIEAYQHSLKNDPFLDKAIYNLAIIYEKLGQHKEAIAAWRQFMLAAKEEDKITMAERYVKELEDFVALNN